MNACDKAEHLESFHQALGEHSTSLPAFVHTEFERYGDLGVRELSSVRDLIDSQASGEGRLRE